jgi:hypothetical protein
MNFNRESLSGEIVVEVGLVSLALSAGGRTSGFFASPLSKVRTIAASWSKDLKPEMQASAVR